MKSLAPLFAALMLAACASTQSADQSGTSVNHAQAVAAVHSSTSTSAPSDTRPQPAPVPAASAAVTAPRAPIAQSNPPCLPARELPRGPLGCTQPPPIPPLPPVQGPRIAWCVPFPIVARPMPITVLAQVRVCGSGFAPSEIVTLTLTSRYGTTSWTAVAGAAGTFQSGIIPASCRNFPGWIVAHGSRGHQSNVLALPALPCRGL